MQLSQKGAHAAQLGHREKHVLGVQLMLGQADIREYVNGVCYDAVAFARYLLGARIKINDLIDTNGQDWRRKFNFQLGRQWNGKSPIPKGTAIGFWRQNDRQVFHGALAVGGTELRGINGLRLGNGWIDRHDLKKELPRPVNGLFAYDNALIIVYLSWL